MRDSAKEMNATSLLHLNPVRINLRQQLCGAFYSIAELCLTDLCYESDAESQFEAALESALIIDNHTFNPDVLQAMATFIFEA